MELTQYHAKYFAYELTKRSSSDNPEKLVSSLLDAQVDLNPFNQDKIVICSYRYLLKKNRHLISKSRRRLKKSRRLNNDDLLSIKKEQTSYLKESSSSKKESMSHQR